MRKIKNYICGVLLLSAFMGYAQVNEYGGNPYDYGGSPYGYVAGIPRDSQGNPDYLMAQFEANNRVGPYYNSSSTGLVVPNAITIANYNYARNFGTPSSVVDRYETKTTYEKKGLPKISHKPSDDNDKTKISVPLNDSRGTGFELWYIYDTQEKTTTTTYYKNTSTPPYAYSYTSDRNTNAQGQPLQGYGVPGIGGTTTTSGSQTTTVTNSVPAGQLLYQDKLIGNDFTRLKQFLAQIGFTETKTPYAYIGTDDGKLHIGVLSTFSGRNKSSSVNLTYFSEQILGGGVPTTKFTGVPFNGKPLGDPDPAVGGYNAGGVVSVSLYNGSAQPQDAQILTNPNTGTPLVIRPGILVEDFFEVKAEEFLNGLVDAKTIFDDTSVPTSTPTIPAKYGYVDANNEVFVKLADGTHKKPSQLNSKSIEDRRAMNKLAVYFVKLLGGIGKVMTVSSSGRKNEATNKYIPASKVPLYSGGKAIYLNTNGGYSNQLNNFNNFKNSLIHEILHVKDFNDGVKPNDENEYLLHTEVYLNQTKHESFKSTTIDFKLGVTDSFCKYLLNYDKMRLKKQVDYNHTDIINYVDQFNEVNKGVVKVNAPEYGQYFLGTLSFTYTLSGYKPETVIYEYLEN